MNILISGDVFSFPRGTAASNYVKLIAKGLVQAGSHVHIVIPNYTEGESNYLNADSYGLVDGVSFEYTTGTPIRRSNIWQRGWGKARSYLVTPWRLFNLRFRNRLDALILYGRSHSLLVQYSFLCRLLKVPLIVYIVEWTLAIPNRRAQQQQNDKRFYAEVFDRADAVIVISRYLEDRATEGSSHRKNPLPCLRMPILCDPQVWQNVQPAIRPKPYLLFCAYLDNYINDALFIIEAMSEVQVSGIDLLMVGKASGKTQRAIQSKAENLNLQDRIVLRTDFVPTDELHSLYAGATALLAPLFNNDRSLARFPSKIAEYLMSGRPVVSCQVGEVAEYLQDEETAFLSEPDNLSAFAEKIQEALTSINRDWVGQRGKKLAQEQFDYISRGQELLKFTAFLKR
jgi:glycosyltransferase involved in cell wall biosynthesis